MVSPALRRDFQIRGRRPDVLCKHDNQHLRTFLRDVDNVRLDAQNVFRCDRIVRGYWVFIRITAWGFTIKLRLRFICFRFSVWLKIPEHESNAAIEIIGTQFGCLERREHSTRWTWLGNRFKLKWIKITSAKCFPRNYPRQWENQDWVTLSDGWIIRTNLRDKLI